MAYEMIDQDEEQDREYRKGWDAGYERGLKAGKRAGIELGYAEGLKGRRVKVKTGVTGRPPKYPFALIPPGHGMLVPEPDPKKVYGASRQYSMRQGGGLRFRCHPHRGGTMIARVDGYTKAVDGDIVLDQNPNYDWIA